MEVQRRLMVVGASPGNLGMRIVQEAARSRAWNLIEANDISGGLIARPLDVTNRIQVIDALENFCPTDIICCVGINLPDGEDLVRNMSLQLQANVWGPIQLLTEAVSLWGDRALDHRIPNTGYNFCAVSSNSAHVARSGSAGYCASKAALSMALRCVARREADSPIKIWGYEPGFIVGTPMSQKVQDRFPNYPLHRIPGENTVDADDLADQIVSDVINAHKHFNGCMIRIDGGEQ